MCNGEDSYDEEEDGFYEIENETVSEELSGKQKEEQTIEDLLDTLTCDTIQEEDETLLEEVNFDTKSLEIPKILTSIPSQILKREGYTTSYNNKTKNANWVAWHLTKDHTNGEWSRRGIPYMVDYDVKGGRQELDDWNDVTLSIEHGHLCPAADCKWSAKAMEQSFLLTNMCPQNSDLNRGDWERLESRCRGWANHYGEIYIAAGPIFYSTNYKTIGRSKVGVPDAFFKVVLCLGKTPKSLGFIYPNSGESNKMQHYVTTVDKVEELTSIDFFYNLPDDIEDSVESVADFNKW